jgi:hypothetical protein
VQCSHGVCDTGRGCSTMLDPICNSCP